jgi:hypothetical protein
MEPRLSHLYLFPEYCVRTDYNKSLTIRQTCLILSRASQSHILLHRFNTMAPNGSTLPTRRFIPREGLYLDPVCRFFARTIFNPLVTGVAFLLCQQFQNSHHFLVYLGTGSRDAILRTNKILTILGGIFWVNQFLNWGANNSFIRAEPWDMRKELVLITGGSGGIGASVARRLAKEGNRVVVLDILPLGFAESIFIGTSYVPASRLTSRRR